MKYGMKRLTSYFVAAFLPLIAFIVWIVYSNDMVQASLLSLFIMIPACFIGKGMSSHPFTDMLEGTRLIVFDITSAGFLVPLVAKVELPYLSLPNRLRTIFDRKLNFYLKRPMPMETKIQNTGEFIQLPTGEDYAKQLFSFEGFPAFLYSSKLKNFVSKEFLSESESKIMTEHLNLVMLDQARSMRSDINALLKHAADQFKPVAIWEALSNPLIMGLVMIILIGLGALMFLPMLPKLMGYAADAATILPGTPISPAPGLIFTGWF